MGFLYLDQGDLGTAAKYLERGLAQEEARANTAGSAVFMLSVGALKRRQKDYEAALLSLKAALRAVQGVETAHVNISIHEGLGAVFEAQTHHDQAIESFNKALDIAERIGDRSVQAEILWWKGEVHYAQRQYEKAFDLSEQACRLSIQPAVPNISRLALTLKGKALLAQGQYDLASQALSHAIDTIEHMRARAAGQEQERALFFEGKLEPYLIEDHALSYAPSLNVLNEIAKRKRNDQMARVSNRSVDASTPIETKPAPAIDLLAFGNPQLSGLTIQQAKSLNRGEEAALA